MESIEILTKQIIKYINKHNKNKYENEYYISKTLDKKTRNYINNKWNQLLFRLNNNLSTIIPVIDLSDSLEHNNTLHLAIGIGIIAAQKSKIKGLFISFSNKPELFNLDMRETDIFEHYLTILNKTFDKYQCNIYETLKLLLNVIVDVNMSDTTLLFLTDTNIEYQSSVPYSKNEEKEIITNIIYNNLELDYKFFDCIIPKIFYWNLDSKKANILQSKYINELFGFSKEIINTLFIL